MPKFQWLRLTFPVLVTWYRNSFKPPRSNTPRNSILCLRLTKSQHVPGGLGSTLQSDTITSQCRQTAQRWQPPPCTNELWIFFWHLTLLSILGFKVYKKNPPYITCLSYIYHHLLSTYMAFLSLWKRHCDFGKEESFWLYTWVINVCIIIVELFVEQICHSDRDETVPLR